MKDTQNIQESELDSALNALFLETYSKKEDENLARFILEQEYGMEMPEKKKKKLLNTLNRKRGGLFFLLLLIGLLACVVLPVYFSMKDKKEYTHFPATPQPTIESLSKENKPENAPITASAEKEPFTKIASPENSNLNTVQNFNEPAITTDSIRPLPLPSPEKKATPPENKKKPLPYFDNAGLTYFQTVKDNLISTLLKLDNQFYTPMYPGSTMYKDKEVLVSPFVLCNFPVTNLQYKVFLADLFRQGRMLDLEKCLPKQEVWNNYACGKLAETYFTNESYNPFPVVNVSAEAIQMFCKWMEEEMNKALAEPGRTKLKGGTRKKEFMVRLPYDYEWIYAVDASHAIISNCTGYNTIYDPSEGLVNASFFKRTSKVRKSEQKKMNRIDELNELNRYGMSENEMIAIYKEAINFTQKKASSINPYSYERVEDCCLAGHVVELINAKDGGTTLRGCCWKDKKDYLKMADDYKKSDASPFVGFRIVLVNKNGTYKEPFW